jgi:pilus assembly protein CpaE
MVRPNPEGEGEVISILLVDDIADTRENIKKILGFERDFKVVGSVGTGREGVQLAKELKPNIVIMDINMPDMDGITATTQITEAVPTAAVIMMSAQDDPDYLRRAMLAGARNFLTKPPDPDELYNTIRTVYTRNKPLAAQYTTLQQAQSAAPDLRRTARTTGSDERPGNIIVVYSPQGGVGCTTISTSLAAGLMREGIRVLLVDADLQFGDVGVFLNLQAQSTLVDLIPNADDLDTDFFENIVVTHDSGLKVLLGPARPEFAEEVVANAGATAKILDKIRSGYDFVVVDTGTHLDEVLLSLMDIATRIILVGTPTLSSVKNIRFVMDLFDQLDYPQDKTMLVLNRIPEDRNAKRLIIPTEKIENFLKRKVESAIPSDELTVLDAIRKGVPVIASQRDRNKSPIRELAGLSEHLFTTLMGAPEDEDETDQQAKQKTTLRLRLGGKA